ncbi:MAG TPA: M24 family metallopeptidase [Candidatus Brocadiia bacterium]|nr:M24 family metallopeptidase [Candidatus Brocadiia bacterium]
MIPVSAADKQRLGEDFEKILAVLETTDSVDPFLEVSLQEFLRRQRAVIDSLPRATVDVGVAFSDEHYCGDVPYLCGNTNISIEQVACAIGKGGCHLIAGLEGGYVAEQLARRAATTVHKVEMLQLADEKYPVQAERLEDVLKTAAGKPAKTIGLLTPRQVIPAGIVQFLEGLVGRENVLDVQDIYYRIKYEKSDIEMELTRQSCRIGDAMMRAMLAVLRPGLLETEVTSWAYFVAQQMGAEGWGFAAMCGANDANRTLVGKSLNRPIRRGDYVHLGASPKRDGLTSCIRRSVVAVECALDLTEEQRFWFDLVEGGYKVGLEKYIEVAEKGLPAKLQEQALVDYFASRSEEVSRRFGRPIRLELQKPYTGTHNAGYTECQEFFGAITLESEQPLGRQIVTMLDVALRGVGSKWNDVVIPGFDFVVVEDTLGKFGAKVRVLNDMPTNVQVLVGNPERPSCRR